MRTFILIISLISCTWTTVIGQYPSADRKAMIMARTEQMADSLQLDSLQKLLFMNAFDQYFTQRFKLREKYEGDRDKIREESKELSEFRDASLKAILTEDQWQKYNEEIKKMMERRSGRRG